MIYVDALMPTQRSAKWRHDESCHLFCLPGETAELHQFAVEMGLKRCWYQSSPRSMPHYDLTRARRAVAIRNGAHHADRTKTVECIRLWRAFRAEKVC